MRDITIIMKNIRRKRMRLFLLLFSIAIAFLLFGVLSAVQSAFTASGAEAQSGRLVVSNKINFTQPIPISYYERVRGMEGFKAVTHSNWFGAYYREPQNELTVYAIEMPSYFQVYPELALAEDQRQACLRDRMGLLVGKRLADENGWQVGNSVVLQSNRYQKMGGGNAWNFNVCGIFTNKTALSIGAAYLNYAYLNEARANLRDTTGLITVVARDPARIALLRQAIDRQFANSAAETDTVTEEQFSTAFMAQLGDIGTIVTLVVGVSFLTILLIVGSTMALTVRERTREIGVLKVLGFPNGRILRIVIGEAMVIATLGGLAGLLLAQLVISGLASSGEFAGIEMRGTTWAAGLLMIALLGLLTAGSPAHLALQLNIVSALGRR